MNLQEFHPAVAISSQLYDLYEHKLLARNQEESIPIDRPDDVPTESRNKIGETSIGRVAIIGAGLAGLRAAMLLNERCPGLDIDIIEANERVGGRIHTHNFDGQSSGDSSLPSSSPNYFDVGAMRFPYAPVMKPLFELLDRLDIKVSPFIMSTGQNWLAYNGIRIRKAELVDESAWAKDPFRVSRRNGGKIPTGHWDDKSPSTLLAQAIQPFVDELLSNPNKALDHMLETLKNHSGRTYMIAKLGYPPELVDWIETMTVGGGWLDRDFIETILEEIAFNFDIQMSSRKIEWRGVDGGAYQIPLRMVDWLNKHAPNTRLFLNHKVTSINFDQKHSKFTLSGAFPATSLSQNEYSHVISAVPPTCLRIITLESCGLDQSQREVIDRFFMGPGSKVGMKFETAWWTEPGMDINGGQSATDRNARQIIYPSVKKHDSCTVLLASYDWSPHSTTLGKMMRGPGSREEEHLKGLLLKDLAYLHDVPLPRLESEFRSMYAYDWDQDQSALDWNQ
ncbi:Flavin containing amine oxidoreductase [Ceratobasidium sp. AG-Ba]|nr:Flavin containing amine oxidoreductase [Ceratobasidium sp. AG-Ba]